jgi:hypothetical protein
MSVKSEPIFEQKNNLVEVVGFKYTFTSTNPDADLMFPLCSLHGHIEAEIELEKRQTERKLAPLFKWLSDLES